NGPKSAKSGKARPGPRTKKKDTPPPEQPPVKKAAVPDKADKEAGRKAFEGALEFAKAHPDKPMKVVKRFEKVGRDFPDLTDRCKEQASTWRAKGVADLFAEAKALMEKKEYASAMRILHVFPKEHHVPPDVESECKQRSDEILVKAKSDAKLKEKQARSRFEAGDVAGAIRILKEIIAFDIVALSAQAETLIKKYRIEGQLSLIFQEHGRVLDAVAAEGLQEAMKRFKEGQEGETDRPYLKQAWIAMEGAIFGARKKGGSPVALSLRDGRILRGSILSVSEKEVSFKTKGGVKTLPWKTIALESVKALGGESASGFPLACLAWYVYRDHFRTREILGRILVKSVESKELADLMAGFIRVELSTKLAQAEEAIRQDQADEAKTILKSLLAAYRDTAPYRSREGDFRRLVTQAAGGFWAESILPFLFRGEIAIRGEQVRVTYDFSGGNQILDFHAAEGAKFKIGEGRLIGEKAGEGEGVLSWPGSWALFEATLDVDVPDKGGIQIWIEPTEGRISIFEALCDGKKVDGKLRRRMPDGTLWTVRKFRGNKGAQEALRLSVGWNGTQLVGRIGEGKSEPLGGENRGTIRLGMRALGALTVSSIVIEGSLGKGWVEGLQAWETHNKTFQEGGSVELVGTIPLERWKREGVQATMKEGVLLLESEKDVGRMYVPEGRTLLGENVPFTVDVEIKRQTDTGYFILTFPAGEKDLAWLIAPERDETPPNGTPEDFPALSMIPLSDGKKHKIRVEIKEGQASLYMDGMLREMFGLADLKAMDKGELNQKGLGMGALGGRWEVHSFRLRRIGK
ncbi:MAG: hypothetical protein ACYTHM_22930, partial [Planctomycetota bacterium]